MWDGLAAVPAPEGLWLLDVRICPSSPLCGLPLPLLLYSCSDVGFGWEVSGALRPGRFGPGHPSSPATSPLSLPAVPWMMLARVVSCASSVVSQPLGLQVMLGLGVVSLLQLLSFSSHQARWQTYSPALSQRPLLPGLVASVGPWGGGCGRVPTPAPPREPDASWPAQPSVVGAGGHTLLALVSVPRK